ncbi:sensor histidine kinase [Paenibacillus sp. TRM 82003]|nr:sensor histidine kinase [Paenibacillus sp. TRM 82003]
MLEAIIRALNDMKLRTKLVVSFVIVVFVPVLIVGWFLTSQLRSITLNNATEQTAINVDRVKIRTTEILNVAYDNAYRLANDQELEVTATTRYPSTYEIVEAYKDYTVFRDTLRLYKEISDIRLYVANETLLNNWEFIPLTEDIRSTPWYKEAYEGGGSPSRWHYIQDERYGKEFLSLVRMVDFWERRESGVLVINVNMDMIYDILAQESFETMIVDASNRIVSANRRDIIGRSLADIDFDQAIVSERSGMFETTIGGIASAVRIEPLIPESGGNSLRIVSVFSIEQIVAEADRINRLATIVVIASVAVAILMIYAFSALLSNRLLRLSKHIQKIASGKLDVVLELDGKDEIGQLARQFNAMAASINELVQEVQETNRQRGKLEAKQNEIKFKMMASQINPHFLFNALESIRMKAHLKGEKDISRVVRLLGKMMRKNLEAGQRTTSLRDEMDMVRCYLDIQKFRYEDRLEYELEIDPAAEGTPIPPLIIQPLVENAVIHGLENKENGGKVTVRVEKSEQTVRIEVLDDGAGMTEEKIASLYDTLNDAEDDERNRIGLRNVHVRLLLFYGPEHGLWIESEPNVGTRIYFHIPIGGVTVV